MAQHRVAVIAGDGIGKEVVPAGLRVLNAALEAAGAPGLLTAEFDWGSEYYLQNGRMMPEDALATLDRFDAIYLGAIGDPRVPDHVSLWGLLLPIRKSFDLYVNLRPVKLLRGVTSPLRDKEPADIDFLCVRENTEGEYAGVGGRVHTGTPYEVALQTNVFTYHAVERIVRYSFELARTRRHRLASITKSNACQYSMVFWDEVVEAVSKGYPDVEVNRMHVDAAAAYFVTRPESFDVVVASNLFADILTDLGGAIQGSLGMAPSANLSPERKHPSLFEPVHGSAPDIAGKGIANPAGAIWAGSMMLDFLGESQAAALVMEALQQILEAGQTKTPDLGGKASTEEMAGEIAEMVRSLAGKL
ncbi:MAG: tartrate dehydrogenase [Chloroflexi bacterium]|nr:tartrate dehydrogenase [Chloroflexota bacterium]